MAKRKKMPTDVNQRAKAVVDLATAEEAPPDADDATGKNAAAVAAGKRGGSKGGRARAESLSAERRSAIARKAAEARWGTAEQSQVGRP